MRCEPSGSPELVVLTDLQSCGTIGSAGIQTPQQDLGAMCWLQAIPFKNKTVTLTYAKVLLQYFQHQEDAENST